MLRFSAVSCYFLLLGSGIFFSALFLITISLYCLLNGSDQVSHPFKTVGTLSQTENLNHCRMLEPKYQSYLYINFVYIYIYIYIYTHINFRFSNQFLGKCVLKVWVF